MKEPSSIKTSGRAGRFKKKLVSSDALVTEAPFILSQVTPFQDLYASAKISQADFTAIYIVLYLSHRYPGTWLGSKTSDTKIPGIKISTLPLKFEKNIQARLQNVDTLPEIFSQFALKSTPLSVNRALLKWWEGSYGLELMFRIPSPLEVLEQQRFGRRCVTTVTDKRIEKYILGERDALSFTMHDLIHADHFYHHNESYEGQLGFYGLLYKTYGDFDLSHEEFAREFEYLIADMNAYPIHLLKCLKSAMIHYFDENHFNAWAMKLNPPTYLFALNTESYNPQEMDQALLTWLKSWTSTSSNLHLP